MIHPDAIKRYLAHIDPDPEIKGAEFNRLCAIIERTTGIPYAPQTTPRSYQVEAVALQAITRSTALFFAPRRGKTKASLDSAEHLRRAGLWKGKGIVIVPSPLLLHVWEAEIAKHSRLRGVVVRSNIEELSSATFTAECDLVIIAWSTLQVIFSTKQKNDKGRFELLPNRALLRHYAPLFHLAIIDELHTIGTSAALRFLIARELLSHCVYRSGLTGTPIGRDPFKLWEQYYVLDQGQTLGATRYFFTQAFGKRVINKFSPSGFEHKFDERKLPLLQQKIAHMTLSYGLETFNSTVIRGKIELQMVGEQRKHYRAAIAKAIKQRDDGLAKEPTFQLLRQISSGWMPYLDSENTRRVHEFESSKTQWLIEFLDNFPRGAKFILFNEFIQTGDMLSRLLTKHAIPHTRIYGGTSTKEANLALDRFANGDVDWIVANTQKACMGISLHAADYMLFYESPCSPKIRTQAEARPIGPARDGRDLFIDDFVTSPVERKIVQFVQEGFEVSGALFKWEDIGV